MSFEITMKSLLESGVHFGHRTNRWDPRMKSYIFTERNGIHIIDLQQTVKRLEEAYRLIRDTVADGGNILIVGTKRQAQETVLTEAQRCGMPYVVERWLPGTLTNWVTIQARIRELERLEKMRDTGEIDRLVKKEGLMIERQIKRLLVHLSGIRYMNGLPDLLFVVDINREETAVHEANLRGVPVIAMVDTNCNPENIDYLVPANDDAIRAIKLMVGKVADAVLEGKAMRKEPEDQLEAQAHSAKGEEVGARISLDEDVDDADLLGESTLQKLAETKAAEEAAAQEQAEAEAKAEAEAESEPQQDQDLEIEEDFDEEDDEEEIAKPKRKKSKPITDDEDDDDDSEE